MLERMGCLVRTGQRLVVGAACSGRARASWLRECRAKNWRVTLLFLWLPSPQAALDRVARRVRQGGHGVPRTSKGQGDDRADAEGNSGRHPTRFGGNGTSTCREKA